jgi:mono/diheme cytochrome c family protein
MSDLVSARVTRPWLIALFVAGALLAAIGAVALGLYWGVYNVAADVPHTQPVFRLLEAVRDRSIAVRAAEVVVPSDLTDPGRVASGAGQYAEMCSSCHLAPGMSRTEISRGLYPRAPELRRGSRVTAAEDFWVIKHGIKATGMPAWGITHDDELVWNVVAFLRKLPELSPEEYRAIVRTAPKTHDAMMKETESGDGHGSHQD